MSFSSVRLYQFRNLESTTIPTGARDVYLVGENGQGKTNFLEAIYYACFGSSFRTRKNETLIQHDKHEMAVQVTLDDPEENHTILVKQRGRSKDIEIDGGSISDRRELVNLVPCIVFCHDDIGFVTGGPEMQRWFMNQTLSLIDPPYLDDLRRYNRVLRSRNAALKSGQYFLLDAFDEQLAESGISVVEKRREVSSRFSERLHELFLTVFGDNADLTMTYRASWSDEDPAPTLVARRDIDIRMGTTTSGPHRDRFHYLLDGVALLDTGSTGQLRLVSLILRVAQATLLAEKTGRRPMLLLDDVLLELDPDRRARFVETLPDYEQAFFTFLPDEQYARFTGSSSLTFRVREGTLHAED